MSSKQTTERDFKVFDPYSQMGVSDAQRNALGQQGMGATSAGLGAYQNWATGNIGDILGNLGMSTGGLLGGGGGGGGGRRGGGGGGGKLEDMRWFELGPEAMNLKNDPYEDEYIARQRENELSRFGQGVASSRAEMTRQATDTARQAGMDPSSPAFMKALSEMHQSTGQSEARGRRDIGSQLAQQAANAKIENLRALAGMETQGGLGNLSASAQDRSSARSLKGSLAGANASRYAANRGYDAAKLGFLGNMAGMSYDAARGLGQGQTMQGLGRPYSINTSKETQTMSPGLGGYLGGALGVAGMFGTGGMFGGLNPWGGKRA